MVRIKNNVLFAFIINYCIKSNNRELGFIVANCRIPYKTYSMGGGVSKFSTVNILTNNFFNDEAAFFNCLKLVEDLERLRLYS